MTDGLKTMPDGFDAMEDSLTRSRSIIESLRAELAKYRGMEVELAAVKNDLERYTRPLTEAQAMKISNEWAGDGINSAVIVMCVDAAIREARGSNAA